MKFEKSESFAISLDQNDPLREFRAEFHIPKMDGKEHLYLCGNSLGLQPKSTKAAILQELSDWETFGVEGHFHAKKPWMAYHEYLNEKLARIVGAKSSEVVAMNSLTTNLHLLMASFYRPTKLRHKIVIETSAFPSDQYAVASQLRFHGYDPHEAMIELAPRPGEDVLRTEDIVAWFDKNGSEVALVLMGGVNYYTGQAFDVSAITKAAQDKGCFVGWDMAHAAGNILLKLHEWNVDFAAWCSYKYLNSGPGGIAAAFVHEKHHASALPRLAGWWGHDKSSRFTMPRDFVPIQTAEAWQLSNPPIFQLAAFDASLEIFDRAGMNSLRKKSEDLTSYLEFLLESIPNKLFKIITPKEKAHRGCQLSLQFTSGGKNFFEKLSRAGVIADWREPDVIRVAPVPLYNSFLDVWNFSRFL